MARDRGDSALGRELTSSSAPRAELETLESMWRHRPREIFQRQNSLVTAASHPAPEINKTFDMLAPEMTGAALISCNLTAIVPRGAAVFRAAWTFVVDHCRETRRRVKHNQPQRYDRDV